VRDICALRAIRSVEKIDRIHDHVFAYDRDVLGLKSERWLVDCYYEIDVSANNELRVRFLFGKLLASHTIYHICVTP